MTDEELQQRRDALASRQQALAAPPQGNRRREGEPRDRYRLRLRQAQLVNQHPQSAESRQMDDEGAAELEPSTNVFAQGMNGVNEGLAGMAGLPIDVMAGALNLGAKGVNAVAGTDIPAIEDPAGGSGVWDGLMRAGGAITPEEPETAVQRYARSIGQEAGAAIVPGAAALSRAPQTAGTVGRFLGLEAASNVGAGAGAQAARDFAPESPTAQTIAALLGGGAPILAARGATQGQQAPSIDDLRTQQAGAYGRVEASGAQLNPATRDRIVNSLQGRIAQEGVPEFLPQPVRAVNSRMEALPANAQITDVEDLRRIVGNDVAGAADGQTRRIGVDLKQEIDGFLGGLQPNDLRTGNPTEVLGDLTQGRDLTRRIAQSEGLAGDTGAVTKALRRASSTGTGGNEVNAIRQNIRAILDNPARRRQYSAEHLEEMTKIVDGTPATNGLRLLGRMSPTSGALPMMANFGAIGAAGATANPLFAAPGIAGWAAQSGAEHLTKRRVQMLDDLVRNGAPLDPAQMTEAQMATLTGLVAAQSRERD